MNNTFGSAASESLARRAQATVQDPVFQKMKGQFKSDFDFTVPGARLLHNLISKLKKWIKILEGKTKQLSKYYRFVHKSIFHKSLKINLNRNLYQYIEQVLFDRRKVSIS